MKGITQMIEVLKQIQQCLKDKMYAHAEMYLSEAIAELEKKEPVAWRWETHNGYAYSEQHYEGENGQPLYTHPPQRTWEGLTHDELQKVRNALAVATTHFARDRIIVLDAIVILNNALAEPPQHTWVGLTMDEIALLHANYPNPQGFALALQAKLKERNT
jgi:hypothetical protein